MKILLLTASLLAGLATSVAADPLQRPARASALAERRLVTAFAVAGPQRIVAVGQRGHVLHSDDAGRHWTQGKVPVSSDLTAVQFIDASTGYAVGHDGVVLGSRDGGQSWTKLLDGRQANALVLAASQQKAGAANASAQDKQLLVEAQRNAEAGPDKPFLDLWFESPSVGFVVGAYNLILRTEDGGRTWQSWFDRSENPKLLNLYAIRKVQGQLYIAGEGGLLMKLDAAASSFKALPSAYTGSYFGLIDGSAGLIAYGMRGNAFLSRDEGRSWQPLTTGLSASITSAAASADGRLLLADQSGGVAVSGDGGLTFKRVPLKTAMPLAAIAVTPNTPRQLLLGGPRGLRAVDMPAKDD